MWKYKGETIESIQQLPQGSIGFIYIITNPEDDRFYIGKKSLYSERTLPPLKGERKKRRIVKESDWKSYQSSNPTVKSWNSPIKQILMTCDSKKGLTYWETKILFIGDCIEDESCLNENILGKFFNSDYTEKELDQYSDWRLLFCW